MSSPNHITKLRKIVVLRQPEVSNLICQFRQLTKLTRKKLIIFLSDIDHKRNSLEPLLLAFGEIKTVLVER
jgi:hypothetical protein